LRASDREDWPSGSGGSEETFTRPTLSRSIRLA
jgi:hypothetical protein